MAEQIVSPESQQLPRQIATPIAEPSQTDEVSNLRLQNQKLSLQINHLTQLLTDREEECRQKDQTIQELNSNLRWQADRIDHLTDQMGRAEALLEKLNERNKNQRSPQIGQYRTPNNKKGKLGGQFLAEQREQNQLYKSQRSVKTEFLTESRNKTEFNPNYVGYNELPPHAFSSANIKKGPSITDTPQLSRYRRQKLMASQNLGDVMKLHKFMTSKYA